MRLRVVALLGLCAACDSPAEPRYPSLAFQAGVVFGIPTLATTAVPELGGIMVSGVIHTETADYTLHGSVKLVGGNGLVLEILVEKDRDGAQFPVQNYYEGHIGNLATGDYDLSVIHTFDYSPTRSERVLHETVHVR